MTLEPLQAQTLAGRPGLRHAFFTRAGGASEGLYAGLNCGPGSDDDAEAVVENRRRAAGWLGVDPARLVTLRQVHSPLCLSLEEAPDGRPQADATATRRPGLALGVLTADCAPILLADAEAGVVGAAHAGWKGALEGVIESTVTEMEALGASRPVIAAAVGPCIAQKSYEVGPEFRDRFVAEDESFARFFEPGGGDRLHFDLKNFVGARLAQAGVGALEILPDDTCPDEARFYSYRRSLHRGKPDYGRLLSAIVLQRAP